VLRVTAFGIHPAKTFIFTPGVSNKAAKAMCNTIRNWRIHLKPDKSIDDISRMFNPVIRGWVNYYGRFYKSALYPALKHMNRALVHREVSGTIFSP
jgi:RNA-directed DNA polymerase